MRRGLLPLAAGGSVVAFLAVVLVIYRFHPTTATVFLVVGWASIMGAGWLLVRSVNSIWRPPGADDEVLDDARRSELDREKKHLLKAIKEVEFDRDTGKMDGGEAAAAIERYRTRAVEILRQLEEDPTRRYQPEIERELARRMQAAGSPVCSGCGATNDDDAAFCKKCGLKLGGAS